MARQVSELTGGAWLSAGLLLGLRAQREFAAGAELDGTADILGTALGATGAALAGLALAWLLWRPARRWGRTLAALPLGLRSLARTFPRPALLAPLLLGIAALPLIPWPSAWALPLAFLALGLVGPASALGLAQLKRPRTIAATAAEAADEDAAAPPIGVLLLDAEEPEAPRARSVRRHLQRVLGDRLSQPRRSLASALWRRYAVAPWRARKLAREYRRVWTAEGGPRTRADALVARALALELGPLWRVAVAGPREGKGLGEAMEGLLAAGCREIRVLPLLPQYAVAASGARLAELHRRLARRRLQPALRIETSLYLLEGFSDALVERCRDHGLGARPQSVVFAFPDRPLALAADPYPAQCRATARILARKLGLVEGEWSLGFGDGGAAGGAEPDLRTVLVELATRGARVLLVPAGVTTDGVETLHGLAVELAADFQRAGGRELRVVPALNDHPRWIRTLAAFVRNTAQPAPGARPYAEGEDVALLAVGAPAQEQRD